MITGLRQLDLSLDCSWYAFFVPKSDGFRAGSGKVPVTWRCFNFSSGRSTCLSFVRQVSLDWRFGLAIWGFEALVLEGEWEATPGIRPNHQFWEADGSNGHSPEF